MTLDENSNEEIPDAKAAKGNPNGRKKRITEQHAKWDLQPDIEIR